MKMDFEDDEMKGMHHEGKEGREKHHDKIMTMEDVANKLKGDLEDEINDSKTYFCMHKVAEQAGCDEDAHYLLEMSKDEYTHAYFIYSFMHEHNIHVPEDQAEDFEELQEKMQKFF